MVFISSRYSVTIEEMKSKFIAIAFPINSVDEFKEELKRLVKNIIKQDT